LFIVLGNIEKGKEKGIPLDRLTPNKQLNRTESVGGGGRRRSNSRPETNSNINNNNINNDIASPRSPQGRERKSSSHNLSELLEGKDRLKKCIFLIQFILYYSIILYNSIILFNYIILDYPDIV
jgi:hypothetical protein